MKNKIWKEAMKQARNNKQFTDRMNRTCFEAEDLLVTFPSVEDAVHPLVAVRKLGWLYPSDEELESIILGQHDQHIYSFSNQIASQLPKVISVLSSNPDTRRAVIQLTDASMDLSEEHVPCLISINFRIRNGRLNTTVYARSIDLLVGLPANLYQAATLAKKVASRLRVETGSISFFMNSAHVFSDYEDELNQVLGSRI